MSSEKWPPPDGDTDPLPRQGLRLTGIFAAVIALGLFGAWIFNTDDPTVASIGTVAPGFDVRNIVGGESVTLDQLLDDGRPIVINLMASWCGPCRAEIPEISAFADTHPEFIVLGVAVEDVYEAFEEFVADVGPTYPVAFDDGDMRARYQSLGLPATFFINSNGTIEDIFNGILNAEIIEELASGLS